MSNAGSMLLALMLAVAAPAFASKAARLRPSHPAAPLGKPAASNGPAFLLRSDGCWAGSKTAGRACRRHISSRSSGIASAG